MDFLLDFNPGDHAWLERIFWATQAALVLVAIIAARLAARNRSAGGEARGRARR